ncbi:hypothetical protein [Bosea sp. (in: a-proteobacteria)]
MTAEDIVAIFGPVDAALVAEIGQIGATREELAQAWAWVNADEALINDGRPLPSGRVAELIDVFESMELDPEK